jgi:hypothetical protein
MKCVLVIHKFSNSVNELFRHFGQSLISFLDTQTFSQSVLSVGSFMGLAHLLNKLYGV